MCDTCKEHEIVLAEQKLQSSDLSKTAKLLRQVSDDMLIYGERMHELSEKGVRHDNERKQENKELKEFIVDVAKMVNDLTLEVGKYIAASEVKSEAFTSHIENSNARSLAMTSVTVAAGLTIIVNIAMMIIKP